MHSIDTGAARAVRSRGLVAVFGADGSQTTTRSGCAGCAGARLAGRHRDGRGGRWCRRCRDTRGRARPWQRGQARRAHRRTRSRATPPRRAARRAHRRARLSARSGRRRARTPAAAASSPSSATRASARRVSRARWRCAKPTTRQCSSRAASRMGLGSRFYPLLEALRRARPDQALAGEPDAELVLDRLAALAEGRRRRRSESRTGPCGACSRLWPDIDRCCSCSTTSTGLSRRSST